MSTLEALTVEVERLNKENDRLRGLFRMIKEEVEQVHHTKATKVGQQVPCHSPLITATPSAINYLLRICEMALDEGGK